MLDLNGKHEELLGDATEHLYQLNHVYVVPPSKTDSITAATNDRFFGLFEVWDYSKKKKTFLVAAPKRCSSSPYAQTNRNLNKSTKNNIAMASFATLC